MIERAVCPRPDKVAYQSADEARRFRKAVLRTYRYNGRKFRPLDVYPCLDHWHLGRRHAEAAR